MPRSNNEEKGSNCAFEGQGTRVGQEEARSREAAGIVTTASTVLSFGRCTFMFSSPQKDVDVATDRRPADLTQVLCWSRMQTETGQDLPSIVARKELERRAG